ncbi:MAG: thioesterase [Clostridia bacterium]|nr:thioesterase [Clostridia bacterium]
MSNSFTSYKFFVKGTDCDVNDEILLNNLVGYMQEAADISASEMGLDALVLNKNNWCWLIISTKIRINRLPRWRENIEIRTWSRGINRVFWEREYEILSSEGEVLCEATSNWIIADWSTHHPVIPSREEFFNSDYVMNERRLFSEDLLRLRAPKFESLNLTPVIIKYADYSELDRNRHVNNSRYLAWFEDAMHKCDIDIKSIGEFTIEYQSEVKEGSKVSIYVIDEDNFKTVIGYNNNNEASFIIKVELKY